MKRALFSICYLILSACTASNAQYHEIMDRLVTDKYQSRDIEKEYKNSRSYKNVVIYKKNNMTHVEYDYSKRCRVGDIFNKDRVLIDWYYISERKFCRLQLNWGGPW